jgi:hypothetical protein
MRRAQHVFGVITCITFNFLLDKHCVTQFHIPSHHQTREMKFFTVLFVCLYVASVSAVERKTVSGNDCIDRGIIFWPYICCSPCTHSPHSLSSFSCPRFDHQLRHPVRHQLLQPHPVLHPVLHSPPAHKATCDDCEHGQLPR